MVFIWWIIQYDDCRACCPNMCHTVICRTHYQRPNPETFRTQKIHSYQNMKSVINLFTALNLWLPLVVSKLIRSFLPISNSAFVSCSMSRSGCLTSRCSNNRMVGLKSLYCSSCLMTFTSTFISQAKSFQFGINLIPLSKHNANCSINGWQVSRTVDNLYFEPEGDKPLSEPVDNCN